MSNKNSLDYSKSAEKVLAGFYNKTVMVYVEGDDDIKFWKYHFDETLCELEQFHGIKNLQKKINGIIKDNNSHYIVACDSDYSFFKNDEYNSPLIVTTYGHSIENTMYCPINISNLVTKYTRCQYNKVLDEIIDWYHLVESRCDELLKYNIGNILFDKGIEVMGDACNRFFEDGKSSYNFSEEKINNFISTISDKFTEEELEIVIDGLNNYENEHRYLIKGHFLTNAVLAEIKHIIRKEGESYPISKRNLFAGLVQCANVNSCRECCENMYMRNMVTKAMESVHIN